MDGISGTAIVRLLFIGLALTGCSNENTAPPPPPPPPPGVDLTVPVPLSEMGNDTWRGFPGGHYPSGEAIPTAHFDEGVRRASAIGPLNPNGQPDPAGRYVLLSVGMSNTTQEYCSGAFPSCAGHSFIGQAAADPAVRRSGLVLVDGAASGQTALTWDSPSDPNYDRVRDTRLALLGLTEQQVRIVWLKVVNPQPTVSLPNPSADAYQLLGSLGAIARALKVRYPHLDLVFLSNRTYGGYATTTLHPEPYAYETGFAVKWLVDAQITQMATSGTPPHAIAGNLAYAGAGAAAPWLAWGPDLWANGTIPRADGLVWLRSDFGNDGIHPSTSGRTKVGRLLLEFLKSAPVSRCWFVEGGTCG